LATRATIEIRFKKTTLISHGPASAGSRAPRIDRKKLMATKCRQVQDLQLVDVCRGAKDVNLNKYVVRGFTLSRE